ncbi:unnamed protein product [Knipowitschia caucasica]|uniref:Importin subunit alpha n=1 Tax=Knipowitschia caucasica TaxID=637954 RepID=A0AAV2MJ00_KNICA
MWRLSKVRHKARLHDNSSEQLRLKRREQEKALRQARKDRQLFSKRLLLNEDDEEELYTEEQDVVKLFQHLQRCGPEKEASLKHLRRALRHPSAQNTFIKLENSMHLLVGLLSGSSSECRLQAVCCLHELSHAPQSTVSAAILPASSYLLTYLSGQSSKFTELCLYTLGNLCPENDVIKEKLLSQGIIPALVNCLETQMHNLALVEAVGFTLSQLLQGSKAAEKIAPIVLGSRLPLLLCSVLSPDPEFGLAPAIECAWCLHYLICSCAPGECSILLTQGALSKCSSLLVSIGGTVGEEKTDEELELLVWPLLRCVGNLVSSCPVELLPGEVHVCLPAALCSLLHTYLKTQPALAREAAWVLNNLTAHSVDLCSTLVTCNLLPGLIQLLPFSHGINTMIVRVLANVAHKKKFYDQLVHVGLLPALCATLKMADTEMVVLSLDVLYMLFDGNSKFGEEFVKQGGLSTLEALQYNHEGDLRHRALYLLEHRLECYLS